MAIDEDYRTKWETFLCKEEGSSEWDPWPNAWVQLNQDWWLFMKVSYIFSVAVLLRFCQL